MRAALRPFVALGLVAAAAACSDESTAPVSPAERTAAPVFSASGSRAIEGSYIVVLKEGGNPSSVAAVAGVEPNHVYTAALTGFAARLNQGQLNALQHNPNVDYIEQDMVATATATQSNATWGIDRVDQRDLPLSGTYVYTPTGSGVKAYVIDTGILASHNDFGGRVVAGYTAINDGKGTTDCNGHGTHVAGSVGGTTYGIAKSVTLVPVRVLDCAGSGTNSGVIAGMDWVVSNHSAGAPAVANMSLGGGASQATDDAVDRMHNDGVTVVVAAGNSNADACNSSPARAPNAITVGSTDKNDARSSFSNWGTCLDIFAPGGGITSAWHTSTTATNTISGTSMASPHVAGVAALYLQGNTSASPATVTSAIINSSTTGKVTSAGTGSPNRLVYSQLTTSSGGTTTTYSGSLSGSGDYDIHPNGTYYQSTVSGTHKGVLDGPSGVDFDLYLYKWNGSSWSLVSRSESSGPDETITYSGTAGYYYWKVSSYSGSGSYTFTMTKP